MLIILFGITFGIVYVSRMTKCRSHSERKRRRCTSIYLWWDREGFTPVLLLKLYDVVKVHVRVSDLSLRSSLCCHTRMSYRLLDI